MEYEDIYRQGTTGFMMEEYKVELLLRNDYKIKIKSNHDTYLSEMKNYFSIHVPNYFFQPRYKTGMWNGKTNFISDAGFIPYGLLLEFIRKSKKSYPNIKIEADDNVKSLFKNKNIDIKYNLKYQPRFYQKEAIEICLARSKGIIQSATASGKSLIISYIINNLINNNKITNVENCLIIVPSVSLTHQFKEDMIDYGIQGDIIGEVHNKSKEWDKNIVISTWQSLSKYKQELKRFQCVIVDEAHKSKAHILKSILSKSTAKYRFGFTGTLNVPISDLYNTLSFIGPVWKEYNSGFLSDEGFISKANVKMIKIHHSEIKSNIYREVKNMCFKDTRRLNLIGDIAKQINDSVLLLVSYLEEGEILKKLINRKTGKEVIFLSGKDSADYREEIRQRIINGNKIYLIATFGIFEMGVNIPNLKYLILSSPTMSKIRTLQSIGRVLRLHKNKKDGAYIIDIVDKGVKFLPKHADKRIEYYESEGFDIETIEYTPSFKIGDILK